MAGLDPAIQQVGQHGLAPCLNLNRVAASAVVSMAWSSPAMTKVKATLSKGEKR